MTDLSDLFNAKTEVVVGGETLALRKAEIHEEAAFSRFLKNRAKREAVVVDPDTPEEDRERLARVALRDVNEGYYDPLAPGYLAAQRTPDGMAEFLYLVLKTDHPNITREKVRNLIENGLAEAYLQVVQLEGELDPKQRGGLAAMLGLPRDYLASSTTSSSASATPPSTGTPTPSGG